jgi:hypothetical protein
MKIIKNFKDGDEDKDEEDPLMKAISGSDEDEE